MGLLDHKELKIIMGIASPPSAVTVEPPPIVINLMDNSSGISLVGVDAWSPKIPGIENSGIWADSPLTPGRTLISAVEGNVTETMKIIITGSSMLGVIKTLDSLYIMANNARAFWTDNSQIQPVYLKWWASCGAGPQYALIYNITIDPTYLDSPTPQISASISIEREPYWRAIPPGTNPKQWTYEWRNQYYDVSHSYLNDLASDHLVQTATLQNKSEFVSTFDSLLSNNCVTIDSSLIPGDAPALMTLYTKTASGRQNFIIGKKSIRLSKFIANQAQNDIFNFADGLLGTNATAAADTGASLRASDGTAKRVEIGFGTATNALRWNANSGVNFTTIQNRFIGRWNIFLRCRQSAGSVGDITMYLRVGITIGSDSDGIKLNVVNPPITSGGTGNTTVWGLTYMGTINIPFTPAKAGQNGTSTTTNGLNSGLVDLDFALFALRSTGVGLLYLNDLILIPVDEGVITLETADGVIQQGATYDETGFFTHGTPEMFTYNGMPAGSLGQLSKFTGTGIQLTPNTENKLYFIFYDNSLQSSVSDTETFEINIVPRWRGIRDKANILG